MTEVLGNKFKSAVYLLGCAQGGGEGEGSVLEDWVLGIQLLKTPRPELHKVASRSQVILAASNCGQTPARGHRRAYLDPGDGVGDLRVPGCGAGQVHIL